MKSQTRSTWQLVEEQLLRWNAQRRERKREEIKPGHVITISRDAGCGGTEIAKKLAGALGMDLMGSKIIHMIAESTEMSDKVVSSLDEREISKRDDWLTSLFESQHLWPDRYLHHLTKVISTIGRHGNAIILGRGANFILPREDTFSIRVIAPEQVKIKNALRTTQEEAKRYISKTDGDRRAFILKYFGADITDPCHYDLVLNMRAQPIDGAVETVITAFKACKR